MSLTEDMSMTLEQKEGCAFRIRFEETDREPLPSDEPAPPGEDRGPNPARLLRASVAHGLSASLPFARSKYRNQPGALYARISASPSRSADGRWRIPRAFGEVQLAEDGEAREHLKRVLQQFEDLCIVTQSVRDGIDVRVTVKDAHGRTVFGDKRCEAAP